MTKSNLIRSLVVAALALVAGTASAFDYHGYFRDTVGFNSKGGTQACYQLPDSYFKARLGNECDRYLEFAFGEGGKFNDSIDWRAQFMPASFLPASGGANSLFVQEMWLGLRFKDWDGAQLWGGRRYWKRHDVHSIDWFYWNPAQGNSAFGIEDVKLGGMGKLALTIIRMDAQVQVRDAKDATLTTLAVKPIVSDLNQGTYMVPEIRAYDIPVNPNGTLEIGVDLGIAYDQKYEPGAGYTVLAGDHILPGDHVLGAKRAGMSPLITVQHNQDKFLGGSNTLVFQYGAGAFAKESGDGAGQLLAGGTTDDKQWRVIEHLVFNPTPEFSGALVLIYQDISSAGTSNNGKQIFTAEVRPAFHVNDWFKLVADVFYQTETIKNAAAGVGSPNLFKLTLAPTFVLGRGYYARPEMRPFVTFASWNKAAGNAGGSSFAGKTSGATFGVSTEIWF